MTGKTIDVEYMPNGGKLEYVRKRGMSYQGIGPRHDGLTVLKVRAPGATRNQNIEVGAVYAVTIDGKRTVFETPNSRWRLRAQEMAALIERKPLADWAVEYFDPSSANYFKRTSDYVPEIDHQLEAAFRDPARVRAVPAPNPNAVCIGAVMVGDDSFEMTPEEVASARTKGKIIIAAILTLCVLAFFA